MKRLLNTVTVYKHKPKVYNHHDNCNFSYTDCNGRSTSGIDTVINLKRRLKGSTFLEITDINKWIKTNRKKGYQIIKN